MLAIASEGVSSKNSLVLDQRRIGSRPGSRNPSRNSTTRRARTAINATQGDATEVVRPQKQGLRARGPLGPDVLRIQRRALDAGVFPDAIGVILDLLEAPPASPISKHVAQRPCDEPECPVPHVAPVDRWGGRILILRCRGLGRRFFRGQPNRSATSMAMKPQIENLATRATGQEPPVLFIRPSNLDDS